MAMAPVRYPKQGHIDLPILKDIELPESMQDGFLPSPIEMGSESMHEPGRMKVPRGGIRKGVVEKQGLGGVDMDKYLEEELRELLSV